MKKYELVQVEYIYIDTEELTNEVINYLVTDYEPENYSQIDDLDIYSAIEYAIDCQNSRIIYADYDNLNEIISNIYHDMVEYIDTHNIEHDLVPVIKNNVV